MKFLMKVGDQLDLNVSYDGGAVDGVSYNAPDGINNKVTVNALGVVTALGLGEGIVNVLSGGAIVGSIAFEVLTSAAYAAQQAIRDGSKALVVGAAAVAPAPAGPILMHPASFSGPATMIPGSDIGYYANNGFTMSGFKQGFYGAWTITHYHGEALPMWDGNPATAGSIPYGPSRIYTWITLPTPKRIAKIEIDIANTTLTGTAWNLEGQLASDPQVGVLNDHGGTWTTLVPATDFAITGGTVSQTVQHTVNSDVAYKKFKVQLYCHYAVSGVERRIDVSAIRLYEPN